MNNTQLLHDFTHQLPVEKGAPNVLVLGDPMFDVYWNVEITGMSAEAPIIKTACADEHVWHMPGGASNVLGNLRGLNIDAYLVYPDEGNLPEKNRLMIGDRQMARFDLDDYCDAVDPRFIEKNVTVLEPAAIVIADYNKGAIDGPVLGLLNEMSENYPVYVDTKRDPSLFPYNATFFPNQLEYEAFDDLYLAAKRVVLKQGAKGMQLFENSERVNTIEAIASRVVNVNGAGDTVMAAFVAAELLDIPNPLYYASLAAAVAVSNKATTIVKPEDIEELVDQLKEEDNAE